MYIIAHRRKNKFSTLYIYTSPSEHFEFSYPLNILPYTCLTLLWLSLHNVKNMQLTLVNYIHVSDKSYTVKLLLASRNTSYFTKFILAKLHGNAPFFGPVSFSIILCMFTSNMAAGILDSFSYTFSLDSFIRNESEMTPLSPSHKYKTTI